MTTAAAPPPPTTPQFLKENDRNSTNSNKTYDTLLKRLADRDVTLQTLVVDDLDDWPLSLSDSSWNSTDDLPHVERLAAVLQMAVQAAADVVSHDQQQEVHEEEEEDNDHHQDDNDDDDDDQVIDYIKMDDENEEEDTFLQELEIRFVNLTPPIIHGPLQQLLIGSSRQRRYGQRRQRRQIAWKSVRFVGCEAPPHVWVHLLSGLVVPTTGEKDDHFGSSCGCHELVLNHNHLPLEAYQCLGRHHDRRSSSQTNITTLKLQRETLTGSIIRAMLLSSNDHDNHDDDDDGNGDRDVEVETNHCCPMSSSTSSSFSSMLDTLETLVFNFCRFDNDAVDALGEYLVAGVHQQEQRLTTLDLGACYLKDEQVARIVNALHQSNTLQTLVLTMNACHDAGSHALQKWLSSCRRFRNENNGTSSSPCSLRVLKISHQQRHVRSSPLPAVPALPSPSTPRNNVESLSLENNMDESRHSGTNSNGSNRQNDVPLPPQQHPPASPTTTHRLQVAALAQGLLKNTSLGELDLSRNRLHLEDILELMEVVSHSPLRILNLKSNALGRKGLDYIATSLPRLHGLRQLHLVNNSQNSATVNEDDDGNHVSSHTLLYYNLAFHLLQGLKQNLTIEVLAISKQDWLPANTNNDDDRRQSQAMQYLHELEYYTALNAGGRRIFSTTAAASATPLSLWPSVFDRAQTRCASYRMVKKKSKTDASSSNKRIENIDSTPGGVPESPSSLPRSSLVPDVLFHLLQGPAVLNH